MADWHVGQQIVCIDTEWQPPLLDVVPTFGQIYTIATINVHPTDFEITFDLVELQSFHDFYHWHFKPVKKTDISIFTGMLKEQVLDDA